MPPATDKKETSILDKLKALLQPVAEKLGLTTITSESRHASPLKKRLETKKNKDNTPSYMPERLRIYEENSEDKDAPQTADLQSYNEAIFDHETPLPQGVTFIKDEDLDKMLEKNKIVADINKIPASKTPLKTLLENAKEAQPYFQQYVQTDETFKNGFSEGKASKNQFKKHVKEGIAKMNVFVDPKTKKTIISFHVFDDQYLSKESEQEKIGTKHASYMFNVILKSPKDLATLKKWAFEQQRAALKNGNQKAAATFAFFSKAMDKDEKLQNLAKDTLIKDLPVYQGDIEKPNTPITFDPVQVQRDYMKKGR